MFSFTRNYSKSPAASFDAVEDVKEYLGKAKWEELYPMMGKVIEPQAFSFYCEMAGIRGFPVQAWYDHYHGGGSYKKAWKEWEAIEETKAHEANIASAQDQPAS